MPSGEHMTARMLANDPTPEQIATIAAEIKAENLERYRLSNTITHPGPGGIRDVSLSTLPGNCVAVVRGK